MPIPSNLQSGEHLIVLCEPKELDEVGFHVRSLGFDVRDCFSIALQKDSLFALVLRVPNDSSILEPILRKSARVLNIGACRIELVLNGSDLRINAVPSTWSEKSAGFLDGLYSGKLTYDLGLHNSNGRYPASFVPVHGTKCKKEKLGGCQGKCPVLLLDRMSGDEPLYNDTEELDRPIGGLFDLQFTESSNVDKSGGASRFFYPASSLKDLQEYFTLLTGVPPEDGGDL